MITRWICQGRPCWSQALPAEQASLLGQGHRIEAFDLGVTDDIPKWIRPVTAETGPLLGLVHTAGVQLTSPIRSVAQKAISELVNTNLLSAIMPGSTLVVDGGYSAQ